MAKRDYYDVLGVARDASAEDIKKAYRKLARVHHPDVSKAPDAQARFTEIQEAYATLSDESKRAQYDRFGHAGVGAKSWQPGQGGGGTRVEYDVEDLGSVFDAFFGGGGGQDPFGGFRSKRGRAQARPRSAPRRELERELAVSFEVAARGGKETLRLSHDGQSRSIEVTIPKGVSDGAKLRIRNALGEDDPTDLILRITVGKHPLFKRDGLDLTLDLPVTMGEAIFGAKVLVPTLGKPVELTVPAGTNGGSRLRLRGRGIEDAKGKTGDLYAVVRVQVPKGSALDDETREVIERVSESQGDVRSGPGWPTVHQT